ncbi:oxidoreductase [Bordetella genomosp. 7]|uniref:Oxidoreductase n=1 Tax=Bordetella genomosp. 7 TaxID=1416805 RepID=A0A261QY82_9BORD|nr:MULTISPECIES: oxidoreductase-like domain-containing protein [Bordetella]OZI17696.1 oxidoreductase [Bordetella genomosp. 7]OZI22208.1 oxidoreductase [Bordetella genomosp. 7]
MAKTRASKSARDPAPDPRPQPPQAPEPGDCCQSGCIPCVYDLYDEAMERYREALRAWQERQAGTR